MAEMIRRSKPISEFHHMELHPASHKDAAGAMSHTVYTQHAPGTGGGPASIQEVEVRHHPTMDHLHAHLKEHMSHMFGEDADRDIADGSLREPGSPIKKSEAGYDG